MKAILALSAATFFFAAQRENIAAAIVVAGFFATVFGSKKYFTFKVRQDLVSWIIILLTIGIFAFVWFCVHRIATRGNLY